MKSSKISALLLCAAMALTASAGCEKNGGESKSGNSSSESESYKNPGYEEATKNVPQTPTLSPEIGENQFSAYLNEETDANDTIFKLNSVIDAGIQGDNGNKYIYLNVDIVNNTDEDYSLSCLNNFYLLHDDNIMEYSDLVTLFYARNNFKNVTINQDPFTVPANGTFSGFICGFEVPADLNSFTVGFYPTKNDATDKRTVIEIKVTPDDIQPIPNEMIN